MRAGAPLAAALILSLTPWTTAASVRAATPCNIGAYMADPDPAGTNIRAAPSRSAPVIGHLPQGVGDSPRITPEIVITSFNNGWAELREAVQVDYDGGTEKRLFRGRGWIWGGLLSTALNRPYLRSRPDDKAPVVAKLLGPDWGADSVLVLAIEDCRGYYAKVRARLPDGRSFTGWADGVCSNQVTTCP